MPLKVKPLMNQNTTLPTQVVDPVQSKPIKIKPIKIKPIKSKTPDLKSIIDNCSYVKNCKSNDKRDVNSISYLVNINLSHSDCIKLGHGVEKIFKMFISASVPNLKDIKSKNIKGMKEKDHLFIDEKNKIVYYAEIKTNLKLDTEKDKSTIKKCFDIKKELVDKYKGYQIKMFLVGCRYISNDYIPLDIYKKYLKIKDHLVGLNEYFEALSIPHKYDDEETYKEHINYLAQKMFKK